MTPNDLTATPPEHKDAASTAATEADSVDKIRDILFGSQMRDHEKRFARLEESLRKDTADLREELRKKLAMFEAYFKQQFDALSNRIKSEETGRATAVEDVTREIKALGQSVRQKMTQLEEQIAANHDEARHQMLDQIRSLDEQIREQSAEAYGALRRDADELRSEKADRAALATMFSEIALRLKGESPAPAKKPAE